MVSKSNLMAAGFGTGFLTWISFLLDFKVGISGSDAFLLMESGFGETLELGLTLVVLLIFGFLSGKDKLTNFLEDKPRCKTLDFISLEARLAFAFYFERKSFKGGNLF